MGSLKWLNSKMDEWVEKMDRPLREEGYAEGYAEGVALGIEEGIQLVREWESRKAEAQALGRPFHEPRPGSSQKMLRDQQIKRQP